MPITISDAEYAAFQQWKSGGQQPAQVRAAVPSAQQAAGMPLASTYTPPGETWRGDAANANYRAETGQAPTVRGIYAPRAQDPRAMALQQATAGAYMAAEPLGQRQAATAPEAPSAPPGADPAARQAYYDKAVAPQYAAQQAAQESAQQMPTQAQSAMRRPLGASMARRPMAPTGAASAPQATDQVNSEARRNAMLSAVGSAY